MMEISIKINEGSLSLIYENCEQLKRYTKNNTYKN